MGLVLESLWKAQVKKEKEQPRRTFFLPEKWQNNVTGSAVERFYFLRITNLQTSQGPDQRVRFRSGCHRPQTQRTKSQLTNPHLTFTHMQVDYHNNRNQSTGDNITWNMLKYCVHMFAWIQVCKCLWGCYLKRSYFSNKTRWLYLMYWMQFVMSSSWPTKICIGPL